jgi:hypothetical protein
VEMGVDIVGSGTQALGAQEPKPWVGWGHKQGSANMPNPSVCNCLQAFRAAGGRLEQDSANMPNPSICKCLPSLLGCWRAGGVKSLREENDRSRVGEMTEAGLLASG